MTLIGALFWVQGIAAQHPGDEGIEQDPDVLFVESFERDGWDARWQERSDGHKKYASIETRADYVRTGRRSLRLDIVAEAGEGAAGWMNYWWDGSDVAYLRYYFRLKVEMDLAGLAAKYPRDEGIARDPDVITFDDFEVEGLEALGKEGWVPRYDWGLYTDGSSMKQGWSKNEIGAGGFAGRRCLRKWTNEGDAGTKCFFDLPKGENAIFYRTYLKIPKILPSLEMRLVGISGVPDGMEPYQTHGAETPRPDGKGPFWVELYLRNGRHGDETRERVLCVEVPQTNNHYILYDTLNKIPMDRWFCLEMMLKLNTPGEYDGRLRVWIDGKDVLTPEIEALSLRRTGAVKIRTVYDQCYANNNFSTGDCEISLDNRVIARKYVGPMVMKE